MTRSLTWRRVRRAVAVRWARRRQVRRRIRTQTDDLRRRLMVGRAA
jgi:hypothetical protein